MKYIMIFLFFLCATFLHAQDINVLLKEASNYEKQLNETEAYKRYAQVAELDAKNITALVKCTEINCAIGTRQKDENQKAIYFNSAQTFAQKAYLADSTNSDVNYAMALATFKLAEVADENKEIQTGHCDE